MAFKAKDVEGTGFISSADFEEIMVRILSGVGDSREAEMEALPVWRKI